MAKELEGKVAAVTGGASGIGLASAEAMLAAGARVVLVDRDEAALTALREKHGDAVIPLVIDLLDAKSCATLMSQILEKAGQLDILHANGGRERHRPGHPLPHPHEGGPLLPGQRLDHNLRWRKLRVLVPARRA